jgi:hypothetical protein
MSSLVSAFLIVWWITFVAVQGVLLVRRWVNVEVLEQHNEVAGFIYAVIGVLYAVCLGFTAIIVWERFDQAQVVVEKEANQVADLFRNAQAFPDDVRVELETKLISYAELVVEKEWPAMAEGKSSPEAWDAYTQLWQTYYRFTPQNDREKAWYAQSLIRLNVLPMALSTPITAYNMPTTNPPTSWLLDPVPVISFCRSAASIDVGPSS